MQTTDIRPLFDDPGLTRRPVIIAGPCSAESRQQVVAAATTLSRSGLRIFRAGVWKPRTKPGGFEGAGAKALEWLAEAKSLTGMLTATEVANRDHVRAAVDSGVDLLWIGARTATNPFAVQEIAEAIAACDADRPVLVKNPVSPDLELWTGAIERLLLEGVTRLGAVHRGFNSYASGTYRNPPQWHIPIELRRRMPGLPLIFDPSHSGGRADLVAPLSQQALDMGFDGLMIECHPSPADALSDSAQQLTPAELAALLAGLVTRRADCEGEDIEIMRRLIDGLDGELLDVLSKRMEIARRIGIYKKERGIPVVQAVRYDDILRTRIRQAVDMGLDPDFTARIISLIHEESVNRQLDL